MGKGGGGAVTEKQYIRRLPKKGRLAETFCRFKGGKWAGAWQERAEWCI